jgi:hypothetical protein
MSGMILGPAILAVTEALLEVWKRRTAGAKGPPTISETRVVSGSVP